jgi:hypothetical protein
MQDLAEALVNRPGWAMENGVALFRPSSAAWSARVAYTQVPARSYERLHVAIVDPDGVARYTMSASTAGEAIRVAETHVRGRTTPEV